MTEKKTIFKNQSQNPQFLGVLDIEPTDLKTHLTAVKIVDVREPAEFIGELGHIEGSELMALGTLPECLQNLPKDQTLVFVCRSGGRSAQASAFALKSGFKDVFNMRGGMLLWNELKLPTQR